MNKTKKLTQGAMLLAIVGALMLIDRQLSFLFEDVIILAIPVVITIYSAMYTIKDGSILCVGLIALAILFGSLNTYMYMPIAIVVGLGVSYAVKKDMDRRRITAMAMLLYIIGEIFIIYAVSPLLGIDIASQVASITETLEEMNMMTAINETLSSPGTFILIIFFVSTVLLGMMEGYLTAILTAFILKRLKIKDIGLSSIFDIKLSKTAAYILLALSAVIFSNAFGLGGKNEIFIYILYAISCVASIILFYFGYLFCCMYMRLRVGRKSVFMLILVIVFMFPFSYFALMIMGFLYGAGPLREKIEFMLANAENKNL